MRVGIRSTSLRADGLEEAFQKVADTGAEGIEVVYSGKKGAKALAAKTCAESLTSLAGKHKLTISSLSLSFLCEEPSLTGDAESIAAAQELISRSLSVANGIKAGVVLLPFFGKNTIHFEEDLIRAADALAEMVDQAEDAGVVMGIESTLNFDRQQYLLDYLGRRAGVKIYVDTGNALARKLDFPTGVRDLGVENIAQIHFKDVRLADGSPPDYDVALGEGDVDFRAAVEALRSIGYDDWVVVETQPETDAAANIKFTRDLLGAAS